MIKCSHWLTPPNTSKTDDNVTQWGKSEEWGPSNTNSGKLEAAH